MTILRNKNVTKVLSVLIAIILWAYVIGVQNPPVTQTITNIPIQLLSAETLARNGLAILEVNRQTVDVVVRGTRADIAQYRNQITAVADVFGYTDRESLVLVRAFPHTNRLTIEEVRPANILVRIENLVSVYKTVNIAFTGDEQPDTEPGRITRQPEQIEIRGPQSLVESVAYVGIEVPYSRISRSGSTLILPVIVLDADGEAVSNIERSSETVSVEVTLFDTKEVPLFVEIIGEINEIYEVTTLDVPKTIRIRGNRSILADIDQIEAEPIDISDVEITSELRVRPILPEGVELARGSANIHVNIEIKGISNNSFEYNSPEIDIQGLSEGLNAYINTPMLVLKAVGSEEILSIAEKKDFRLSVNLQGLGQGTHVVPVIVSHDKALSNLEITPGEVHITINEEL